MIHEFVKLTSISVDDILGNKKDKRTSDLRHLYWKLLRDKENFSYPALARMNGRTSASIIHGIRKIEGYLQNGDKWTTEMWNRVKALEYGSETN
ncbi:hypothetical protein [Limibacterium fermenti]|uniref:hypothetical protein n=1 Tax=Limibacterium fermenti TaxID=3229863 RepID=UPI000E97F1F0|nr:hypothetical protein [Porphyromonadaceae bacterium]